MNKFLGLLALVGIAFIAYNGFKKTNKSKSVKLDRQEKE